MKMIIGGAFQGKTVFLKTILEGQDGAVVDGGNCPLESPFSASAVTHFHLLVRRLLVSSVDVTDYVSRLIAENPSVIIVSTELGYGIVPVEKEDRIWRETTGRVCTLLASQAEEVYRVICGIPTRIK